MMAAHDFKPYAEYDADADAIYVQLLDAPVTRSKGLDDLRNIDYSNEGGIAGVELLGVGGGVDLLDVPHRHKVEELINELGLGIKIFA